jgi:cyanosortase A-associated protein
MSRRQIRTSLLFLVALSVFVVLGKVMLTPTTGTPRQLVLAAFNFPRTVPLDDWQLLDSRVMDQLPSDRRAQKRLLSGQLYEYQKNDVPLEIEMRYTLETSGNVIGFLTSYTSIPPAVIQPSLRDERHRQGVGYYILFVHQQRAYLTSCINPKGGSTVTLPQFRHNRYAYDLRIERLFKWLIADQGIRDDRCLWVNMSVPLDQTADQNKKTTAYAALETAWLPWFDWWQSRFPES